MGYYKFKKALCSFKYLFPFFLFKHWVLETELRIEFLTLNTGVWNQLHKTLLIFLNGFTSLTVLLLFPLLITVFAFVQGFLILFHLTQMMFFWSTHLLMFLSLETSMFIIRTGLLILLELTDLVNSVVVFLSQTTLLPWEDIFWTQCICCCHWVLWASSSWNWCIYPQGLIQAVFSIDILILGTLISMCLNLILNWNYH